MAWLSALLKSLPFANAGMLLWGLAASMPIIIHLLSRRKYNEVTWAAMEFLIAALRKNARRIRIEQLILLLVRIAILLLLGVALADPIFSLFPTLGTSLGTSGQTHFVLVLDGSYSMDYRVDEKSRFELAKDLAMQIVQDSRQGDGFSLVLMGDPPEAAISDAAFDAQDVLEEIDALRLRHAGASLPMTLSEIEHILKETAKDHTRLTERRVCFLTDLGRTTWDEVNSDDCRERLGRLADIATLFLFDVGQPETQNLAATILDVKDELVTVGRGVTIESEIQNFGSRAAADGRVVFLIDGQQVHSENVDVSPGDRLAISFQHTFQSPGEHQLEMRLADDLLPVDNHRWSSVPVRESIDVLCIEGRQSAARFVAYALEPGESSRPRVRPQVRFESALLEQDLSRFDCVFLCNLGRISREDAGVLYDFVTAGGGLVVTLGDQVQADNYNTQLGGEVSGRRILPARLLGIAGEAQYFFDPQQYRHPIVAPFADHERSGLLTTPVWKYFRVERYDPASAQIALAFQNGDPAIVEQRVQRGRCILLTTAASPDSVDRSTDPPTPWTAMATWPSFPPLIQEMLALAVRRQSESRNLSVGEPIDVSIKSAAADVPLTVESPDGETQRVQVRSADESSEWVFGGTMLSGIYTAVYGPPLDTRQRFAVNVDTHESNLERFDAELLPSQFNRDFQADEADSAVPVTRPTQYFRYFLGLVLLLLLLETFLAWHFGNASA
jgi:hypothetical protein